MSATVEIIPPHGAPKACQWGSSSPVTALHRWRQPHPSATRPRSGSTLPSGDAEVGVAHSQRPNTSRRKNSARGIPLTRVRSRPAWRYHSSGTGSLCRRKIEGQLADALDERAQWGVRAAELDVVRQHIGRPDVWSGDGTRAPAPCPACRTRARTRQPGRQDGCGPALRRITAVAVTGGDRGHQEERLRADGCSVSANPARNSAGQNHPPRAMPSAAALGRFAAVASSRSRQARSSTRTSSRSRWGNR